jgi:Asp/Glu/hydantoin racemase
MNPDPSSCIVGVVTPTIVVVHDVNLAFAEIWPAAKCLVLLDEALYDCVTSQLRLQSSATIDRISRLLQLSAEGGARAIVFAGSVFADQVRAARVRQCVPVLTSFEAMIEDVLDAASRILVVSSAEQALPLLVSDLRACADRRSQPVTLDGVVVPGAFDALYRDNDRKRHDALVAATVAEHTGYDAICLTQFSMRTARRLLANVKCPVFDPLTSSVRGLMRRVASTAES